MTKRVVISAVNLIEGGTLTVLRDCLKAAANHLPADWEITALVHEAKLIDEPRVRLVEVPQAKQSYWRRLKSEWIDFMRFSRDLNVDLWLSLHDVTPRVQARRQVVYCQNAMPFYSLTMKEALLEPRLVLFNKAYLFIYGRFIDRNDFIIVQQEWIRQRFRSIFRCENVIVAHPSVEMEITAEPTSDNDRLAVFLFPSLPRPFKNFETILSAACDVYERTHQPFEVRITISPDENRYARHLYRRYGSKKFIKFISRQPPDQMIRQYSESTLILFPSKLESWGMPLSEAKCIGRPIIVANEPYAVETIGSYHNAKFVPATDVGAWTSAMLAHINGTWQPDQTMYQRPAPPFAKDWRQTWDFLVNGL